VAGYPNKHILCSAPLRIDYDVCVCQKSPDVLLRHILPNLLVGQQLIHSTGLAGAPLCIALVEDVLWSCEVDVNDSCAKSTADRSDLFRDPNGVDEHNPTGPNLWQDSVQLNRDPLPIRDSIKAVPGPLQRLAFIFHIAPMPRD
jgi:hypothetical protein